MKNIVNFKVSEFLMALYLVNGERLQVQFEQDQASMLSYPAFAGGRVRRFQNEQAYIFFKEFISDLFSIHYKIFRFARRQKIEIVSRGIGMHSAVMLQNELRFAIDPLESLHQKEGTISLFMGQLSNCQTTMDAGVEYRTLEFHAGTDLVRQLKDFFPGITFDTEKVRSLFPFPCFISPALHKVIDDILDCPYDENTSRFYFDVKVREYFYLLLQDCVPGDKAKHRFTPYEIEQLYFARELLLADISRPPFTIRKLARAAGINEFKLKVGFTQFFKVGVFECLQRARMHKAKQLLLHTHKPIKEICTLAGYPRMTNFITAFRKFFGCTPGAYRRK